MYGLITSHGTVLCLDRPGNRVVHRKPAEIDAADIVLVTELGRPDFGVFDPNGAWRSIDVGTAGPSRATVPPMAQPSVADGLISFHFGGGFLGAPPDGTIRLDGAEALDWECFGLVGRDALADLIDLCTGDWIRLGSHTPIGRDRIGLADRGHVRMGEHLYPIAGNLPFSTRAGGRQRRLLFREGWMVDAFVRFRPLVYFVLMGAGAYVGQLRLAAESLVEFGGYGGDILVITDRERSLVEAAIPSVLHPKLSLLQVASSDKVDAVLARLMLGEHANAADYAPILYSDTDVIFDRPLVPFLHAVLLSGRMSAQSEPWNELPGSDAAGGELFARDPTPARDRIGFNAGVWAMPGGADSLQVVDTIRLAISRYLQAHGRGSLPWLDQAMANYVLRKLDAFDARLMTAATRLCQAHETLDAALPTGFVHFWPVAQRAEERAVAMAEYLGRLRVVR